MRRYSEQVKLQSVEDYLSGDYTLRYIALKYGIHSPSNIINWSNHYQREGIDYFSGNLSQMGKLKSGNQSKKGESSEFLKRENEDLKLLVEYYQRLITQAEEDLQIKIEKKYGTK